MLKFVKRNKKALNLESCKLVDIAEKFGIKNPNAHRALADAITTAKILIELKKHNK